MAGKKNHVLISVNAGLTEAQASAMLGEISKAKNKIAPNSRSTAAITSKEGVTSLLQSSLKKIGE